jgi:hypothetical protein
LTSTSNGRQGSLSELTVKFFGREVALQEGIGRLFAELGPSLKLVWEANELALMVGSSRVSPAAGAATVQRAAEILEERFRPMGALFKSPPSQHIGPVPMALHCPKCNAEHVDRDEWATSRAHHVHLCEKCGHEWQPFDFDTVGIVASSDESDAEVRYCDGGYNGPGWYYLNAAAPDDGACGAYESFEQAAREAVQTGFHRVRPPQLVRPA